ncbi:MAG: hypothetical protein WC747_03760 [Candidatus Babeliales bacterium]
MKRIRAIFCLLFLGSLSQNFILADTQKRCSTKCSISKNTWLTRSFASYQMHEIIAQKKIIQQHQDAQHQEDNQALLMFDHHENLLTPSNNSLSQNDNQAFVELEQQEDHVDKASDSDSVAQHEQTILEKKQVSDDQDFEIFDSEKDYVLAAPMPSKNTTSYLAAFTQRVKQKARKIYSYLKSDNKKSLSSPVQISQSKLTVGQHKQDYLDMQQLAEEMREELEDNKEYVRKKLFYENKCRTASKYNSVNISFLMEYMQNFGGKCGHHCKNLGSMPFWSGTNIMTVGSNDGRADLDAYQLGLGKVKIDEDGIAGVIQLNPKVQHVGADIYLHWAAKQDERGLYFKVHIPFGAVIIYPQFKELVKTIPDDNLSFTQITANPGSTKISYQFPEYPTPFFRPSSVSEAFFGGSPSQNHLNGNRHHPIRLRKGRIAETKSSEVRFGDLTAALGYNVVANEKGLFGVAFKVSCPTGNVPLGDYMLESIFGRAGLWGVGADISGFYNIWNNAAGTKSLNFAVQGEVLHLIQGRTPNFRTFDLKKNGPGSKYLIIQKYTAVYDHRTSGFVTIENMEPRTIQPAANITTVPVISNIGVEGSLAVMLDYRSKNWNFDIGTEFWGRTAERLAIDVPAAVAFRLTNFNNYAVLGRQVGGYLIDGQPNLLQTFYCEPLARIGKSQDAVQLIGSPATVTKPAYADLPDGIKDARIASNRIPSLLEEALDIPGAQASAVFTGKVFGQAGYTWVDRCFMPSLSVVAGVEFTDNTNNMVQLWSLGLRGSLQF